MKKDRRIRKINKHKILYVLVMAAAFLGMFLPGRLLLVKSERELSLVSAAPLEYYSAANMAIARNASVQLGNYQKLQLISGRWESTQKTASSYERELEAYEIVQIAKEKISEMYQKKLYPFDLMSQYGNWYTWDASSYKAVDATFGTYAAYYWDISFHKYDGSERHRVCILEDGTIFLIEIETKESLNLDGLREKSYGQNMFSHDYFSEEEYIKVEELEYANQSVASHLEFLNIDAQDLNWIALSQAVSGEETYHLVQAYSGNRYVAAIYPTD